MKLYAPIYYKDFKCIADRCRHSCCVSWEIDVDEDALLRYKSLGDAGKKILESIDFESDFPHFRRLPGGRCPHREKSGRCRIISEHGEKYLCDICREHPRFFNAVSDRCEVGIGAVCEEAARLILQCENYAELCLIGETEAESCDAEFDVLSERSEVFSILSDSSHSYNDRLLLLYENYGISPNNLSDGEWHEVISSLEYLLEKSRDRFLSYSSTPKISQKAEEYLERALAYFIFRHTGSSLSRSEFVLGLGLSLFLERLFASLLSFEKKHDVESAAMLLRLISEEIEYSEENTESIKFAFL